MNILYISNFWKVTHSDKLLIYIGKCRRTAVLVYSEIHTLFFCLLYPGGIT